VHALELLDLRFEGDQLVGERLGGRGHLGGLVGVAGAGGLVGHQHRLAGVGRQLLQVAHAGVEAHLGLLLVGDDRGGLLDEQLVLLLGLGDRLFQLDLGVRLLIEAHVELGGQVLPEALDRLEHVAEHRAWRRGAEPQGAD
jgi:hypothetical protein